MRSKRIAVTIPIKALILYKSHQTYHQLNLQVMCVGLRPAVARTAEVDLTHNRSFNSSPSTVTIERQNMDSECIVNHVLVKSGVIYSKPAKILFKVRKNMHNLACVHACMHAL